MILLLLSTIAISCQTKDIDMFFVADLSREAMLKEDPFFRAEILNSNTQDSTHYTLVFKIISEDYGTLVEGTSDPFVFNANPIKITSQTIMEEKSDIKMQDYTINAGGEELKHTLRTTGILPAGEYILSLSILNEVGEIAHQECTINLKNPGNIESIYPGVPFGNPPQIISTRHPVFQWSSDGDIFKIIISRVIRDDITPAEAIEENPIFTVNNVHGYTFYYPDDAPELEDGLYAWQITSTSISSSGEFKIKSRVYWFQVLTTPSEIVEILRNLLGEGNPYIKNIESESLTPTGAITLDGRFLGITEFKQIIDSLTIDDIEKIEWRQK